MLLALYRIGATIVLVAPKLLLAITYNIATVAGEGGASLGSVFDPLQLQRDLQSCGTSIRFPPEAASASFFRTYRQVGLFRV